MHRFRTQIACRIAGIDRDRFNEAVAAGYYPCAPETERGSTRVFDETQLIILFYYARLLDWSYPPRIAGFIACQVYQALQFDPSEDEIVLTYRQKGLANVLLGSAVQSADQDSEVDQRLRGRILAKEENKEIRAFLVFQRVTVDIKNIRAMVRQEIAEELSIVGPDDDGEDETDKAIEAFKRGLGEAPKN